MNQVGAFESKEIYTILMPTFEIFTPLLQARKESIKSISSKPHNYGSHERHKLDVYEPPFISDSPPILVFLYGGGLVHGDKIIGAIPDNLVYHNLGTFFATRGFLTIIPDYRRVNDTGLGTGEDAVFPSGGQDVAAVVSWIESMYVKDSSPRDVFLMGNSAGGIHLSTYLLAHPFGAARKRSLTSLRLRGAILLSVPFHFKTAAWDHSATLETYYGNTAAVGNDCPLGLLQAMKFSRGSTKPAEFGLPPVLMLVGEFDPEDEILQPTRDFSALWQEVFGGEGMTNLIIKGHNHISPPIALMSGDVSGEQWGEDLVKWMRGLIEI